MFVKWKPGSEESLPTTIDLIHIAVNEYLMPNDWFLEIVLKK